MTSKRDINDIWAELVSHPDYVFGTFFQADDFEGGIAPDFNTSVAEDVLTEHGHEIVWTLTAAA